MINCFPSLLFSIGQQLKLYTIIFGEKSPSGESVYSAVSDELKFDIDKWLKITKEACVQFEIHPALSRIEKLNKYLENDRIRYIDLSSEFKFLSDLIVDGLKNQYVFRYTNKNKEILSSCKREWKSVILEFPEAESNIKASVDLLCMDYPTSSMYHSICVLEVGLKAMCGYIDIESNNQNWHNIIELIESTIQKRIKSRSSKTEKERLEFYSKAAKEFMYFKEGWRNFIAHGRRDYQWEEAKLFNDHVRFFMGLLAQRQVQST